MGTNPNTQVLDNVVDQNGGLVWHRLHSEREDVCEALLREFRPDLATQVGFEGTLKEEVTRAENWHRELLQARLGKIDNALDRLMTGSFGGCTKCGRWIEDTKLDFDPTVAFCIECWQRMQNNH